MKFRALTTKGEYCYFTLDHCPVRVSNREYVLANVPGSAIFYEDTISRGYDIGDKTYYEGDEVIDSKTGESKGYLLDVGGLCVQQKYIITENIPTDFSDVRVGCSSSKKADRRVFKDINGVVAHEGDALWRGEKKLLGNLAIVNDSWCLQITKYKREKVLSDLHILVREVSSEILIEVLKTRSRTPLKFKCHDSITSLRGFVTTYGGGIAIEADMSVASVVNPDELRACTGFKDRESGEFVYYGDIWHSGLVVMHNNQPHSLEDGVYTPLC